LESFFTGCSPGSHTGSRRLCFFEAEVTAPVTTSTRRTPLSVVTYATPVFWSITCLNSEPLAGPGGPDGPHPELKLDGSHPKSDILRGTIRVSMKDRNGFAIWLSPHSFHRIHSSRQLRRLSAAKRTDYLVARRTRRGLHPSRSASAAG